MYSSANLSFLYGPYIFYPTLIATCKKFSAWQYSPIPTKVRAAKEKTVKVTEDS